MTQDNDNLEKIGKRMPYSMPPDLFERVQGNVLAQIEKEELQKNSQQELLQQSKLQQAQRHRKALIRRITIAITAVAASVCLVFLFHVGSNSDTHNVDKQQAVSLSTVDKAYDNLSQEEQENLVADYDNDIYMNLQ